MNNKLDDYIEDINLMIAAGANLKQVCEYVKKDRVQVTKFYKKKFGIPFTKYKINLKRILKECMIDELEELKRKALQK